MKINTIGTITNFLLFNFTNKNKMYYHKCILQVCTSINIIHFQFILFRHGNVKISITDIYIFKLLVNKFINCKIFVFDVNMKK